MRVLVLSTRTRIAIPVSACVVALAFCTSFWIYLDVWARTHPIVLAVPGWTPVALPHGRVCYITSESSGSEIWSRSATVCIDSSGRQVFRSRLDVGDVPMARELGRDALLVARQPMLYRYVPLADELVPLHPLPPGRCTALATNPWDDRIAALCADRGKGRVWVMEPSAHDWRAVTLADATIVDPDGGLSWGPVSECLSLTVLESQRQRGTGGLLRRIAVVDLASGRTTLTTAGPADSNPAWSPNGHLLVYVSQRGAELKSRSQKTELVLREADRAQPAWLVGGSGVILEGRRSGLWRVPVRPG